MADNKEIKKEQRQRGIFKKKRAGEVLTKDEIRAIKAGRKKLRREMREMGIKSKKEFELTASGLELYFDKNKKSALFFWLFFGKGGWLLLAAGLLLLAALYAISFVTELKGHFTISLSDEMFRQGFTISETVGFENPTAHLFATPATDVPCISILQIPDTVDQVDGGHNANYFAQTFYIRNEGNVASDYQWQLHLNAETLGLSEAAWIMIFENGKMTFYAKAGDDGNSEMLPAADDNTRGYQTAPLYDLAKNPRTQYQVIQGTEGEMPRWRVIPKAFLSDTVLAQGTVQNMQPMQTCKYTVVIWLEGDDPDCTDALRGGYMGLDFRFFLLEEAK